jgi:hypothetical protein
MYEFCIRSWNVCGCNELSCSEAKLAKKPSPPPIMKAPVLTKDRKPDCKVPFSWAPISDNGAPIESYEMQIAAKGAPGTDLVFHTSTFCGD